MHKPNHAYGFDADNPDFFEKFDSLIVLQRAALRHRSPGPDQFRYLHAVFALDGDEHMRARGLADQLLWSLTNASRTSTSALIRDQAAQIADSRSRVWCGRLQLAHNIRKVVLLRDLLAPPQPPQPSGRQAGQKSKSRTRTNRSI